MPVDTVSPTVDQLVALVQSVADIGLVYPSNIRHRQDIAGLVVSSINGVDTLRAWWVQGPTTESRRLSKMGDVEQTWIFELHGIEGLDDTGTGATPPTRSDLERLRANAFAVCAAIDGDEDLREMAFRIWPCVWRRQPIHTTFGTSNRFGAAYVVLEKRLSTLQTL
jgi:hypothetical protein